MIYAAALHAAIRIRVRGSARGDLAKTCYCRSCKAKYVHDAGEFSNLVQVGLPMDLPTQCRWI